MMAKAVVLILQCLLLLHFFGGVKGVEVYEFQAEGEQSDSYLTLQQPLSLQPLTTLTFCLRLRFYYLWEVSGFLQVSSNVTGKVVHTISAEVNLNYIRVTLAQFRRYHFLKHWLRALTWHHLCLTYDNDMTVSYLDGVVQDRHKYELVEGITGNHIKVGAWDDNNSYSGQLSQVNIWSRALTPSEVMALAECTDDQEGDVVSWKGPWQAVGDVSRSEETTSQLCQEASGTDYFVFKDLTATTAFRVCEGLGGFVPTPQTETEYDTIMKAVEKYPGNNGKLCKPFWVGITDEPEEGVWTLMREMSRVDPPWAVDEPDGSKLENCAVAEGPQKMADQRCDELRCVVCEVPRRPVWTILGACERHKRNTHFVALQDNSGKLLFRGYSDYHVMPSHDGKEWLWWDWRNNQTLASIINANNGVPIGRQEWTLRKPMCGQKEGDTRLLLLTPCPNGYFSCDDASCIRLAQRCDLKFDCADKSDESGCQLVRFPPVYRRDLPPVINSRSNLSEPLPVSLLIIIESADVDTPSMHMHVNLNMSMTWQESRLNYLNLNEDYTLNRCRTRRCSRWVPVIDFTNTKGNHITQTDYQATLVVNMLGNPTLGEDKHPEELEVYSGPENPMSVRRKYSITFQCQFDLKMYPFDEQYCHMELTMLSASSRLLVFDSGATKAIFEGNQQLVEYFVGDVDIDFHNDRDFAVIFVKVQLLRRAGFIIMNVYIPSLLLLVISYLTLYFTPTNFQVRVLASLTSLLVMATLYTQASSSLPKTSYFKMMDVWLLSSIFFIFIIIVLHTTIDRVREWELTLAKQPIVGPPTVPTDLSASNKSSPSNTVHPSGETAEATQPADVEEPQKKWWETVDLCLKEAVARIPERNRKRLTYEKMILGARVFVLVILIVFNIIYWSIILT